MVENKGKKLKDTRYGLGHTLLPTPTHAYTSSPAGSGREPGYSTRNISQSPARSERKIDRYAGVVAQINRTVPPGACPSRSPGPHQWLFPRAPRRFATQSSPQGHWFRTTAGEIPPARDGSQLPRRPSPGQARQHACMLNPRPRPSSAGEERGGPSRERGANSSGALSGQVRRA